MEDFIYSLSRQILSDFHLDKMLLNISNEIKNYLGAERASLFIYDPEDNTLNSVVLMADTGSIKRVQIPVNKESIAGFTAMQGKILNIKNVHNFEELYKIDKDLRYHSPWLFIPDVETTSMISVPIKKDGKLLGVFQAINKKGGFTIEDEEKILKIIPLLAIALDRAISINHVEMVRSIEKTIFDNISEGVVLVDYNFKIKQVNSSFLEMLGFRYKESELINMKIFDIIPNLREYERKFYFVMQNNISEELLLEMMRIKIIPISWECFHRKDVKYLALIFDFPRG